jgi:hypothetical protein
MTEPQSNHSSKNDLSNNEYDEGRQNIIITNAQEFLEEDFAAQSRENISLKEEEDSDPVIDSSLHITSPSTEKEKSQHTSSNEKPDAFSKFVFMSSGIPVKFCAEYFFFASLF